MNPKAVIIAIDQGTTSSRTLAFDEKANLLAVEQIESRQFYPEPAWVEQDGMAIWEKQWQCLQRILKRFENVAIAGIGITNQRETTVIWDRKTGKPIAPAIIWQDKRTADICRKMKSDGLEKEVRKKTGLVIDSYFSASKIHWILNNVPSAKEKAVAGELFFGTIDSWLIYNLSAGKCHITDVSNASRTMLFNIHEKRWDDELLSYLDIPASILPEVVASSGICGYTDPALTEGKSIPIAGIAGDQQAALFGQQCFAPGMAKNTYGTGCFMLMNTGEKAVHSDHGLLTTIAWEVDGRLEYALEGSVFIAGAAVQWLRDAMRIIEKAPDSEEMAQEIESSAGVYVVPAFNGLGAPYWDMNAKGAVFGLGQDTGREHLVRATLESLAFQTADVLHAMQKDADIELKALKVDGGASANNFLMQFQSDLLNIPVKRPTMFETTALGAAQLAAIATGFWEKAIFDENDDNVSVFYPAMDENLRYDVLNGWTRAVKALQAWSAV